jgi:translation initiation factor 5
LGGELGTQVKIDDKKSHYVINGAHEAEKLQSLLDVFIDKFVLCQSCKNPETEFVRKLINNRNLQVMEIF